MLCSLNPNIFVDVVMVLPQGFAVSDRVVICFLRVLFWQEVKKLNVDNDLPLRSFLDYSSVGDTATFAREFKAATGSDPDYLLASCTTAGIIIERGVSKAFFWFAVRFLLGRVKS